MKKDLKRKWIKALRGEGPRKYRQGREVLKVGAKHGGHATYCCLGVLACEMGLEKHISPSEDGRLSDLYVGYDTAAEFAGLFATNLDSSEMNVEDLLIEMNDDKQMSFRQIADWVEENL
jgi:hypothetical protein